MSRLFTIVILISILSCNDREVIVEKSELMASDYRLFQSTSAWELAKAVQDYNSEIISKTSLETINTKDSIFGNTLVMLCIINDDWSSFKALIKKGASVNYHNSFDGTSPIIRACKFGMDRIKYIELLIESGANVNDVEVGRRREENQTRLTPLIAACQSGDIELVEFLISQGADINYENEFNQTALRECLLTEKYEIAILLIKQGADVTRPLFYRPEKNEFIYLPQLLREDFFKINSKLYRRKMEIVNLLKAKGINYYDEPIPEYIINKAKEEYPNGWKEYLDKY